MDALTLLLYFFAILALVFVMAVSAILTAAAAIAMAARLIRRLKLFDFMER